MNAMVPSSGPDAALIEKVIVEGDLSKLTPAERISYYKAVCTSVGLNPLTTPFSYIVLNNKMVLYALRGATDQLRSIHKVSVVESTETEREGVLIVTTKVQNAEGRTDIARGAVNIQGLKGENLANAILKAETKAKRRATLSICGLGLLDETEVEAIPNAIKGEMTSPPLAPEPPPAPQMSPEEWVQKALERIRAVDTMDGLTDFENRFESHLKRLMDSKPELFGEVMAAIGLRAEQLG